MKAIRVLSLFDGVSVGQLALERAGIPIEVYYASEVDKYALAITQNNYSNTIQLGDVEKVDFTQYEGKIDLLIGGSPCTNLSIAGNRKGLEGDESRLFWEYVRAIKECKPKYFLLENVESMSDKDKEIISKELGCYPIMINSSLVSAQNRKRYYWFNWGDMQYNLFGFPTCDIPQPKDKGILLKDILESGIAPDDKSRCIQSSIGRTTEREYFKKNQGQMVAEPIGIDVINNGTEIKGVLDKSHTLLARDYKGWNTYGMTGVAEPVCVNSQSGRGNNPNAQPSIQNRIYDVNGKSTSLTTSFLPNIAEPVIYQLPRGYNDGGIKKDKSPALTTSQWQYNNLLVNKEPIRLSEYDLGKGQAQKVYSVKGKSVTLLANGGGQGGKTGLYKIDLPDGEYIIRKLTPIECERLQTMPDNFTQYGKNEKDEVVEISKTQRYKCIGNSWTADVIAHIFSYLKDELDK